MARKFTKIVGVVEAQNGVNRMLETMHGKSMKGLLAAADYLKERMDTVPPFIPKDSGNLEESWFRRPFKLVKTHSVVEAGFNKPYAVFVHERVSGAPWGAGVVGDINWSKPGSGPKFLEIPLKRDREQIVQIVADHINPDLKVPTV